MIYSQYLLSPHWDEMKEKYKKDYCEICGSKKKLNLHHKDYRRFTRENKRDFITLCELCHHASHVGLNGNGKLKTPSRASAIIANRMRINVGLKATQCLLFLKKRYAVEFINHKLPSNVMLRKLMKSFICEFPGVKTTRYKIPSNISDLLNKLNQETSVNALVYNHKQ